MLHGKGFYIWKIKECENGDVEKIAEKAAEADFSHVLVKIADGTYSYNYDWERRLDFVPPLARELHHRGIQIWGWHFVYGTKPVKEAQRAIQRIHELNLDGYVIDAEGSYKGKHEAAKTFMQKLEDKIQNIPIALSSYRAPSYHPQFPWNEFLSKCDYTMPQLYWKKAHNPGEQLRYCVREFKNLPYTPIIVPTGAAFTEDGWAPNAAEVEEFLVTAKELNLPAANFWEWENCRTKLPDSVWEKIAELSWNETPVAARVRDGELQPLSAAGSDIVEQYIQALNTNSPEQVAELYTSNGVHITPKRTIQGATNIKNWYLLLFNQTLPNATFHLTGHSGTGSSRHLTWTAESPQGNVLNGNDTLGLVNGKIAYHFSHFKVSEVTVDQYKVTAYCLNVRKEASGTSQVIGALYKDDVVTLLEKSPDLYWYKIKTSWDLVGWASHKFLVPTQEGGDAEDDPPWLKIAYQERGVKEFPGNADNPRIVEYHKSTTLHHSYAKHDETPWCSSFVNWCVEQSNYEGTDSAMARSWNSWGKELSTPRRGCIVVFKRPPNPNSGHVGFYIDDNSSSVIVLGGNQSDEVNISPQNKKNLLSYRWPAIYVND